MTVAHFDAKEHQKGTARFNLIHDKSIRQDYLINSSVMLK